MDKLIFQGEGWPLTQEALQFMQDSQDSLIRALVRAYGNNCIISDLDSSDYSIVGQAPSGWLIFESEIMPFVGGTITPNVVIVEETTEGGYDTNNTGDFSNIMPVWKKRYAKFSLLGSVSQGIPYSSLKRVESNSQLMSKTRFLKKGKVRVNIGPYSNIYPTEGNFISAEDVTQTYGVGQYVYLKINFHPIAGDYFPIIHRKQNQYGLNNSRAILIDERAEDYLIIGLMPPENNSPGVGNLQLFEKLEIYLLG